MRIIYKNKKYKLTQKRNIRSYITYGNLLMGAEIYTRVRSHPLIHKHTHNTDIHINTHTGTRTYIKTLVFLQIHMHIYTRIHIHNYMHIHIQHTHIHIYIPYLSHYKYN